MSRAQSYICITNTDMASCRRLFYSIAKHAGYNMLVSVGVKKLHRQVQKSPL